MRGRIILTLGVLYRGMGVGSYGGGNNRGCLVVVDLDLVNVVNSIRVDCCLFNIVNKLTLTLYKNQ